MLAGSPSGCCSKCIVCVKPLPPCRVFFVCFCDCLAAFCHRYTVHMCCGMRTLSSHFVNLRQTILEEMPQDTSRQLARHFVPKLAYMYVSSMVCSIHTYFLDTRAWRPLPCNLTQHTMQRGAFDPVRAGLDLDPFRNSAPTNLNARGAPCPLLSAMLSTAISLSANKGNGT